MIMSRTPLRISFFGGGTDYPEYFQRESGAILGTAIDKFSYITASPFPSRLFDYSIRVSYRKVELVKSVQEIEHNVYRECLKHCGLDKDVELHNVADLPSFSGLGSSSTFTVGLLRALHALKGEEVDGLPLAYEAIHIERRVLRENVGCQDQTLAAVGGFHLVEFKREDDIRLHPVELSPSRLAELEAHLFVVFTGISRRASDVVATQLSNLPANRQTLAGMRVMVDKALAILTGSGSLTPLGHLLHEAWQAKRSLSDRISNSQIDGMYDRARQQGALGGKVLGAGGGGFLLFFAPPDRHAALRASFADFQEIRVRLNAPGSQIVFSST
jgi:D-glycero-alpha-D-manno-heptose-7-phosphate kinase